MEDMGLNPGVARLAASKRYTRSCRSTGLSRMGGLGHSVALLGSSMPRSDVTRLKWNSPLGTL